MVGRRRCLSIADNHALLGTLAIGVLTAIFIYLVLEESETMRRLWSSALFVVNMASIPGLAIQAQGSLELSWYPPSNTSVNNLTTALSANGVYGFIFNSSYTPDARYGTYNWCNMPHVRKTEYVRPSSDYKLKYVEIIQRHHKRTPYASNAFPIESYHWDCDDQGLYYYGAPFRGDKIPASGFWKGFISPVNPYVPSGWIGTCQFPQITAAGLDDSYVHGQDIYGVYHDMLGFLPARDGDWRSKVIYRVTQNVITSQVAGMLIGGTWGTTESIPLLIEAVGIDSLEPQYSCNTGSNLFNSIKSSSNPAWQAHLDAATNLYKTLDDISGVPPTDSGFHASFDHYFDNLSARQCHAKPLPCKLVDGSPSTPCINQTLADAVYRLGQWEYSQIYRDAPPSLAASVASYGVWIAELAAHLRAVVAGEAAPLYFHNVAHDGSVSRLLSVLQIDVMVWPGMGSEVVFELYEAHSPPSSMPTPTPSTTVIAPGCHHDNCLRQMIQQTSSVSAFCPTFTSDTAVAVPTWLSNCLGDKGAVSSACSCLVAPTTSAAPTTTSAQSSALPTSTKPSKSGHYIRVLFSGQVLKSSNPSLGVMDMLPVETLLAYFDGLVGMNASMVMGKCSGSVAT